MTPRERKLAAFILTHGRPDKVHTYNLLQRINFQGDIHILIDNEDTTAAEYIKKFGKNRVHIFDKLAESKQFDTADLSEDRRAIVYARNASQRIAKQLGYQYIWQLDDDYSAISWRKAVGTTLKSRIIKDINGLLDATMNWMETSGAKTVAFAQGGDSMGALDSTRWREEVLRKAMNSFIINLDNPIKFVGRLNEDVNAYTLGGSRGDLYFTLMKVQITQPTTQQNKGGMTDVYLSSGTWVKSFYTVMMCPSAVKVRRMGKYTRYHHKIYGNNVYPKILSHVWQKPRPA